MTQKFMGIPFSLYFLCALCGIISNEHIDGQPLEKPPAAENIDGESPESQSWSDSGSQKETDGEQLNFDVLKHSGLKEATKLWTTKPPLHKLKQMQNIAKFGQPNPVQSDQLLVHTRTTALELEILLRQMQTKLAASEEAQAKTRSIIHQVQQRQGQQENVISSLRRELQKMKQAQVQDSHNIRVLQTRIGESAWTMDTLKSTQEHIKREVHHLNNIQIYHNNTLDSLQKVNPRIHLNTILQSDLDNLSLDVGELKLQISKNRKLIKKLQQQVVSSNKLQSNKSNNRNSFHEAIINSHSAKNTNKRITIIPTDDIEEGSGSVEDKILSKNEERDNTLETLQSTEATTSLPFQAGSTTGHKIHPVPTEDSINHIDQSSLANLYEMLFHMSVRISDLENKLLVQQKEQFQKELKQMQDSFLNFTHHILTIHTQYPGMAYNVSFPSQKDVQHLTQLLDNHAARIGNIEQSFADNKEINRVNMRKISGDLDDLKENLGDIRGVSHKHRHKASGLFELLNQRLGEISARIDMNHNRLAHVEVKVLNSSLQQCSKFNKDILQDVKIRELDSKLFIQKNKVSYNEEHTSRLQKSVKQLYDAAEQQGKVLDELIKQSSMAAAVMFEMTDIRGELDKLMYTLPSDCEDILRSGQNHSGTYLIRAQEAPKAVKVYCFMEGGTAWTTIQRRIDGTTYFSRTWDSYKEGFGDPAGNHWTGNDNIHFLTTQGNYSLRIEMVDTDGRFWLADYGLFSISSGKENFALRVDEYGGNATDSLSYSNNMPFSTIDKDNDLSSTHCAKFYTSGWWYKHCHYSNLNGRYTVGSVWFNNELDEWIQLKQTLMKVRRVKPKN